MAEVRAKGQFTVALDVTPETGAAGASLWDDVRAVAEAHPGSSPLEVRWNDGAGQRARWRSRSLRISASGAALKELRALLGDAHVRLERGT
jgi:DNA polymerase-3 subunit alpha